MSSCAACQERDWATYSDWAENCSSQDRDNASHVIITPSNTSVPSWALVDTSKGKGTFDLAVAYTVANHGSGSNPYAGGGGLAPAAIAGISVGVTAVIVIALMLLFYRRSPSLPSPGSPRSTSSKWRKLLRPRQSSSHSYEHVQGFQGPPPSPIIKARRTRVSSSVANSDFLIDKDSAEGPLTPRTEATESMGGVQGRLLALFGNRGRTSIQTADLGGARDFTFVSSASPTDAPGEPHHELESFLPRPESSQPRSRSGSTTRGRQTLYPSDSVSVVDIPVTVVDTDNQRRRSISPFLGEKSASSGDHKHSPQRSGAPSISTGSFVLYPPVAPATAPYGADLAAIYRS
ncbi:hypothetical protein FRC02_012005 [Tulasnella sp. 418]|nr:hypothetical protein FRC02_012005 [Tulasnella sp. 418]